MSTVRSGHLVFGVGLVVLGYAVLVIALAEQAQRAAALASVPIPALESSAAAQPATRQAVAPATAPPDPAPAPSPAASSAGAPSDATGDLGEVRLFKFSPGGAAMARDEVMRLIALGKVLARRPVAKVSIEGFGDRPGAEPLTVGIAKHRAKVAQMLLAKAGVTEDRVTMAFVDMGPDPRLAQIDPHHHAASPLRDRETMKSDPSLLLLASLGAALLTAGGAFLRAAFANGARAPGQGSNGDAGEPVSRLSRAEGELASLRDELVQSNSVKEAQRIEMVEQRQRSERQVQGAQAEIQRLASEVDAEKARFEGDGGRAEGAESEARHARRRSQATARGRPGPRRQSHGRPRRAGGRPTEEAEDRERRAGDGAREVRSTGATRRRGAGALARARRGVEGPEGSLARQNQAKVVMCSPWSSHAEAGPELRGRPCAEAGRRTAAEVAFLRSHRRLGRRDRHPYARDRKPHLVCIDLRLPRDSGYEVCEFIRRTTRLREVPILVMSEQTSAADRAYAEEAGADGFLPKPFSLNQFTEQVRALMAAIRSSMRRLRRIY